jgi:predicted dienelactone hydrolase
MISAWKIGLLIAMGLIPATAEAAGLKQVQIPADARGPAISALVWTPCDAPPENIKIEEPLIIRGVWNCPIRGRALPLIVISHGGGGPAFEHYDTAQLLADNGFAVVALQHPNDHPFGLDRYWLVERPTDVQRVLNYMLRSSAAAQNIDSSRIGFFGFSRGGYTGLMLAGGSPHYPVILKIWLQLATWIFHSDMPSQPTSYDPRFRAFVLADPLSFFPDKESLRKVSAPLQLWSSEKGGAGVTPEKVAGIARDLPTPPEFHLVRNSAHPVFAFPCSSAVAKVAVEFCTDPPGLDRASFHKEFNAKILRFFRENLSK